MAISTIDQQLTLLPEAPQRSEPSTFSTKADAFVEALSGNVSGTIPGFDSEMNTIRVQINTVTAEIDVVHTTIAGLQNYQGAWSAGTYTTGQTVSHDGTLWIVEASPSTTGTPGLSSDWVSTGKAAGVNATTAEQNYLAGVVPGTAQNNKAAVLGANRNLDYLNMALNGLAIGGVPVTSSAAELNKLDGVTLTTDQINRAVQNNGDTITGELICTGGPAVTLSNPLPTLRMIDSTNPVDNQIFTIENQSHNFDINIKNDSQSLSNTALRINRSGQTVNYVSFPNAGYVNFNSSQLAISGSQVHLTAAELNLLDGLTASASELNILDGCTLNTTELNRIDGLTAVASELNKLDGVPAGLTSTEIGYLDGVTSSIQGQFNSLYLQKGTTSEDPNTTTYPLILTNHANAPEASGYYHIRTYWYSTIGGNAGQIAVKYGSAAPTKFWVRSSYGGAWNAWVRMAPSAAADFSGSRVAVTNASGQLITSAITTTELDYLNNINYNIKTAIDARLPTAGGTMTGTLAISGSNYITFGDTAQMNDNGTYFFLNCLANHDFRIYDGDSSVHRFLFDVSHGHFHADGNIYAYSTSVGSDEKLKENITTITDAVSKVQQLKGVQFDWIKDGAPSAGLIAQDVQKVLPEAVRTENGLNEGVEHLALNYNCIIGLLVEAIKEQQAQIDALRG